MNPLLKTLRVDDFEEDIQRIQRLLDEEQLLQFGTATGSGDDNFLRVFIDGQSTRSANDLQMLEDNWLLDDFLARTADISIEEALIHRGDEVEYWSDTKNRWVQT